MSTSAVSGAAKEKAASVTPSYKWIVLVNTTLGMLMASVDGSIVTIALPDITRELHATVAQMMWVLMGYLLLVSALLLPIARLSDIHGRVRFYTLGFAVFTVGSVFCGFAHSAGELIVHRLIQGVGAAMLYANSTALVTDAFPGKQRGVALGINMMIGTSGFVIGTLLGGVITQYWGWRYIFFVNLPVGLVGTLWAYFQLREIGKLDQEGKMDWAGTFAFAAGAAALLGGLTLVVMHETGQLLTWGLFGGGAVLIAGFVALDLRIQHPMMDLRLFAIREFWAGNLSLFLNALSRGSIMFILSWYYQAVQGDSPVQAGIRLIPLVGAMLIIAPISGALSDRLGARWLATGGLVLTLIAQVWLAMFPVFAPEAEMAAALIVLGVGNSTFSSPNTSAVMGSVPENRRGIAAGMRTLCNNLGQACALGIVMTCLSTAMSYQALSGLFTGASSAVAINKGEFMKGFHEAFLVGSLLTLAAIAASAMREQKKKPELRGAHNAATAATG